VGLFQIGASLTLESTAISSGLLGCTVPELFGGLQVEPTPVFGGLEAKPTPVDIAPLTSLRAGRIIVI
jgi:hypothetical protein